MGNSPSRYDETDWNEASGGLKSAAETVDGSEPTTAHVKLIIVPCGSSIPLVGQLVATRDYQVKDDANNVLFTTRKIDKLEKGFDLVDKSGETTVLRVDSDYSNRTWHIYQVNTPVFEGQHPDPKP
jgi:hypothetical protein